MIKHIYTIFALLFIASVAQAQKIPVKESVLEPEEQPKQEPAPKRMGLHFSASLVNSQLSGISSQSGTQSNDRQRLTSFAVAATKEFELSERSRLETGLGLEQLGDEFITKRQLTSGGPINVTATYTTTYEMNYVTIPLAYNYTVGQINQMGRIFFTGGLRLGFLLGAYRTESIDSKRRDISGDMKKYDPRASVGVGVESKLSSKANFLGKLEYQRSLTQVSKASFRDKLYNDSVGLSVGIGL